MLASKVIRKNIVSNAPLSHRMKSTIDKSLLMKYLTTPPYTIPNRPKIVAPPMVYISGEEMTRYTMQLM